MEVFPSQQHNLTASTATKAIAWVCKNQLGIRAARTRAKESERLYEKISEDFRHGIAKEKSSIIKVGVLADRQRKSLPKKGNGLCCNYGTSRFSVVVE